MPWLKIYRKKEKQSQQLFYSKQDIILHVVFCFPDLTWWPTDLVSYVHVTVTQIISMKHAVDYRPGNLLHAAVI